MTTLRSAVLRLASELPRGNDTRRRILAVLKESRQWLTPEQQARKDAELEQYHRIADDVGGYLKRLDFAVDKAGEARNTEDSVRQWSIEGPQKTALKVKMFARGFGRQSAFPYSIQAFKIMGSRAEKNYFREATSDVKRFAQLVKKAERQVPEAIAEFNRTAPAPRLKDRIKSLFT